MEGGGRLASSPSIGCRVRNQRPNMGREDSIPCVGSYPAGPMPIRCSSGGVICRPASSPRLRERATRGGGRGAGRSEVGGRRLKSPIDSIPARAARTARGTSEQAPTDGDSSIHKGTVGAICNRSPVTARSSDSFFSSARQAHSSSGQCTRRPLELGRRRCPSSRRRAKMPGRGRGRSAAWVLTHCPWSAGSS